MLAKLSIIIPTLNEQQRIETALESALATNPHEVIVADGGSTDDTLMLVGRHNCRIVECPRGRAVQQNRGASTATGDVLLFLHADCEVHPESGVQIAEALKDQNVVAGAFWQRIPASGILFRWLERGNAARVHWRKLPYGDQGIFVRRDVFNELNGFPNEPLMEDLLLMRRIRKKGKVVLLDGPLTVCPRRWQKHGVIRQTIRNWSLLTAARMGVPLDRLARLYRPHWEPTRKHR